MTPAQIALTQRYPVGSVITLGQNPNGPKATISGWTTTNADGTQHENGLCFFTKGESPSRDTHPACFHPYLALTHYNVVHGFDSEENSISTDNYPYGSLRTTCRWWIETATKGSQKNKQRFMQQTINPKNSRTNKPHSSNYFDMQIMYVEGETGHVKNYPFAVSYGPNDVMEFVATGMFAQLHPEQITRLADLVKQARNCKINGNYWTRNDFYLYQARYHLANHTLPDEAIAEQIAQDAYRHLPGEKYGQTYDIEKTLRAVKAEITTGKPFNL